MRLAPYTNTFHRHSFSRASFFFPFRTLFIEPKMAGVLNTAGINAIFPSQRDRIAHMTGARGRVEGGGQLADEGIVKGDSS